MEVASRVIELEWKLVFLLVYDRGLLLFCYELDLVMETEVLSISSGDIKILYIYSVFISALYIRDCNIRRIMLVTWLNMVVLLQTRAIYNFCLMLSRRFLIMFIIMFIGRYDSNMINRHSIQ